jgi:thiamine-phosphate pyrophosphorylase
MKQMHLKHYVFINTINEVIKKNIVKFKDINIVINIDHDDEQNIKSELDIIIFAKKNKIPFLIKNNFKKAIQFKASGVFIDSSNKKITRPLNMKKNFLIMGSAHNQFEYYNKLKQNCKIISLSPIFNNNKYSKNKILHVVKFNLISKNWKTQICALGGINEKTLKKIKLTNVSSVAFSSYISKKPNYHLR